MSMEMLLKFVILMGVIVLLGFFNEKVTGLTYEIALMLFSLVIGVVIFFIYLFASGQSPSEVLPKMQVFKIDSFLMDGVLCFMLFAGSCHMKFSDFRRSARPIGVLAVLGTFLGTLIYGFLFYGFARLVHIDMPLPACLLFGSIISPTDPIAATSILNKFGLPKETGFIIEGESLLNDGVGVALFVFFSGMVASGGEVRFFPVMIRQIAGAVVTGFVVTWLCYFIFKKTENGIRKICCSLLMAALSYYICEKLGFSGAIASVVCGVTFSSLVSRSEKKGNKQDLELFYKFWEVIDSVLNSTLYVMLGLTFIHIFEVKHVLILFAAAVICNLIGRAGSVGVSSLLIGPIPDNFSRPAFIGLLTWGGLRGGLCIALALSAGEMLDPAAGSIVLAGSYAVVFFTTVIQGLTMKSFYRRIAAMSPR